MKLSESIKNILILGQSESGTVEMDAGIMDGTSLLFGAVGAVPGIKNPIMVAQLMVEEQRKGLLPLGTDDRLVGLGISLYLVMFFHLV